MVETQDELKIGIGSEEAVSIKPAMVKVVGVSIEVVGQKNAKKVVLSVMHPDKKDAPLKISSAKFENKGKLEVAGLWFNTDSKKQIKKGSGLAVVMNFFGVGTLEGFKDKELPTTPDEKGYLTIKAY